MLFRSPVPGPDGAPHAFYGPKVPAKPVAYRPEDSLIVPIPPVFPLFRERIDKLFQPTRKVLSITEKSVNSGETLDFGKRVWDKAWTDEPFILAGRTIEKAKEIWNRKPSGDDDDKSRDS